MIMNTIVDIKADKTYLGIMYPSMRADDIILNALEKECTIIITNHKVKETLSIEQPPFEFDNIRYDECYQPDVPHTDLYQ